MKFTLDYPPSVNRLYSTVNGRRVLSREGRAYKAKAALMAYRNGADILQGEIVVTVDVYRPRKSGDLDNTLKILLDSLTGITWVDDRQIIEIRARRFEDKLNPRAEIHITEVQP